MTDPSEQLTQARVSAWLRSQGDVTIPPEVADRLQQSIAAEAGRRGAPALVDLDARRRRPVDVTDDLGGSGRPSRGRWLLAASVVATAALGALLVPPLLDGGADLLAGGGDDSADTSTDATSLQPQGMQEQESAGTDGAAGTAGGTAADADDQGERASIDNLPPVPDELQALVLSESSALEAPPGCGRTLVDAIGGAVTAGASIDTQPGGVVLLVDEASTTAVWWLPSCDSGPEQALGRSAGMPPS